jgi:hypothetical protein
VLGVPPLGPAVTGGPRRAPLRAACLPRAQGLLGGVAVQEMPGAPHNSHMGVRERVVRGGLLLVVVVGGCLVACCAWLQLPPWAHAVGQPGAAGKPAACPASCHRSPPATRHLTPTT